MRDFLNPPVAFHFSVAFSGNAVASAKLDSSFQEVSGLTSTMEVDDYAEGGENRFSHKLPKTVSHPNLVLKRGVASKMSPLVIWSKETLEAGLAKPIQPKDIVVMLLDEKRLPVRTWSLSNCWPLKWEVAGFESTSNKLAIETMELAYNSLERLT